MLKLSILFITSLFVFNTLAGIRVASYNIRNFDYDERSQTPTNKSHLVNMIAELNADVLAVQEINEKEKFIDMVETNFFGQYQAVLSECGGAHGQKLGFVYNTQKLKLIKFSEDLRTVNPNSSQHGQHDLCNFGSRPLAIGLFQNIKTGKKLVAISVHLKAGGRDRSIKKRFKQHSVLGKVVSEFKKNGLNRVVIMGDFNSTEYILKNKYHQKFVDSVNKMGMVDTTDNLQCSSYWWGGVDDGIQYPSALDHILLSPELINNRKAITTNSYGHCKALRCKATHEFEMGVSFQEVSDHCPVLTELK